MSVRVLTSGDSLLSLWNLTFTLKAHTWISHTKLADGLLCWLARRLIILILCEINATHFFNLSFCYLFDFSIYLALQKWKLNSLLVCDFFIYSEFLIYLTLFGRKSLIRRKFFECKGTNYFWNCKIFNEKFLKILILSIHYIEYGCTR